LFNALGLCSRHEPGEITRFGRVDRTRFRVDAVMTSSDWQRISIYNLSPSTTFDFVRRSGLALTHCQVGNTVAHRYEIGDEFLSRDRYDAVGNSNFYATYSDDPGFDPERPGEFERWARAATKRAERFMALHSACNGAFGEMLKVIRRQPAGPQQLIVAGLIPRGVITLLLARKGVGKTNALLELAVAVAERKATWWDFQLHPGDGFVVFLLGEGSIEEAEERVRGMNGGQMPLLLRLQKFDEGTMIEQIIANLKKIKVDLLIVDPARKYYLGDEDGSDAVSQFFTNVEAFANQTKAGLVVSHHLKREANPRSIHEVPRQSERFDVRRTLGFHIGTLTPLVGRACAAANAAHRMSLNCDVRWL
jgi:AAA domain